MINLPIRYEHDRGGYRITPDTAGIFGTYPSHHLTYAGGVGDQVLGTALLLLCVCAITDKRNMQVRCSREIFFVIRYSLLSNQGEQATGSLLCWSDCSWYWDLLWLQLWLCCQPC